MFTAPDTPPHPQRGPSAWPRIYTKGGPRQRLHARLVPAGGQPPDKNYPFPLTLQKKPSLDPTSH